MQQEAERRLDKGEHFKRTLSTLRTTVTHNTFLSDKLLLCKYLVWMLTTCYSLLKATVPFIKNLLSIGVCFCAEEVSKRVSTLLQFY